MRPICQVPDPIVMPTVAGYYPAMPPHDSQGRPAPDPALTDMADYVHDYEVTSAEVYRMARCCLLDSLGCAMASLNFPDCTKLLGPVVAGIVTACVRNLGSRGDRRSSERSRT